MEYASAEAFLDRDRNVTVECILLDIDLGGGMSGLDLQCKLVASDGPRIPVIFVTALEDKRFKNSAVRAGCIAYLQKPFAGSVLIAAINRALGP
ncbi:response regulator receiver protein [Rhizobium grahamii CCGE 502]|uniref:Response regulator receiver protein n=1 Tax=Rhizobium grahamii CCGE 502 TaxID=990285 RepID=S3HED3_9HYPH|nr:response regulator receiver protein [Rhizobium grahamii CCGE 502]